MASVVCVALDHLSLFYVRQRPLRHSPLAARLHHRHGAPDATPGVRSVAVTIVDSEDQVSVLIFLPLAFAASQVPSLAAELRLVAERGAFPDDTRVGVDPLQQLRSQALALRVEPQAQPA